jgi:hypothetical protein
MHLDEGEVKAADEEAGDQQPIAPMRRSLAQGGAEALLLFLRDRRRAAAPQCRGDRDDRQGGRREQHQGQRPAPGGDEALADRREQELPE